MSIRLRFTLLYNIILAVTLAVFGISLFSIQSGVTYDALKKDLILTSETIGSALLSSTSDPGAALQIPTPQASSEPFHEPHTPLPFQLFSGDPAFKELPEREIVRVLDASGNLVASPQGRSEDALPLSAEGIKMVQEGRDWWEKAVVRDQNVVIYSRPILARGQVVYILQVARSLSERDRSLETLEKTIIIASLVTLLAAFGIGWVLSGITLQPIQRLTHTARTIGEERDFTRRVSYTGPLDEVGELATTFNSMLSRLEQAYQKVHHALEMQRNFVADVSHELRTPLTTLRGNLGLLRREPPIPADERGDILNDMVDESDRLIRLVNDLLVLARADAGRNLARETLAIFPIIEESCRQAQQLDPQREISMDTADVTILGDRDALKQVMLIALDNALKHSSGRISVTAKIIGNQVEIQVQDQGEGISPEKLEHIFDRFYQGEESAATIPGFGLGLPIAKALVEGMGGTIEMQSETGKGSIVTFHFLQNQVTS